MSVFSDKLTGRLRWRPITSWWGRHLGWTLQVEIHAEVQSCDIDGLPLSIATTGWRDVTLGDLPVLDISVSSLMLDRKERSAR